MAQRITLDLLTEKGACSSQTKLFAKLFPNGTEVTKALCIRYAEEFDFYWAAEYLLPKVVWQEYLHTRYEALTEYYHIRDNAWAEYERIRREALEKWRRIRNSDRIDDEAWAEYERIAEKALAEYSRIAKKAWTECARVLAVKFGLLWNEYMP